MCFFKIYFQHHPAPLSKGKRKAPWDKQEFKTESTRKLSNFNIEWTKTLYQNNKNNIALFFLHFSRAIDVISFL